MRYKVLSREQGAGSREQGAGRRGQEGTFKLYFRQMKTAIEHLLKLTYWQTEQKYNQRGWKNEIRNFRLQIKKILKDSPSLKLYLAEIFSECYQDALNLFMDSSAFTAEMLPSTFKGTLEQVLDENGFLVPD